VTGSAARCPARPGAGAALGIAARGPEVSETGGYVVVRSRRLARQVLTDPVTFAPDNALDAVTPLGPAAMRVLVGHGFRLPPTLANNGGESHAGLRAVVAGVLAPERVEAQRAWLTGEVRRRVIALAAALRGGEAVDLHAAVSHDLPLLVLARLAGLPAADAAGVKAFSRAALELFWAPLPPRRQQELAEIVGRHHAHLRHVARGAPGLAAALRAHAGRHGLGEDEVVGSLFFLLVAGQETTSQLLTLLLHRLVREPSLAQAVATEPARAADVVEEGLRLDSPVVTWRRVARRDVQLGGVHVRRGYAVLLHLAACGRDPSVAAEPDRFVPGQRGSRRHVAFGVGAHRCLGADLARLEAQVVVTELAPLLPRCMVVQAPAFPASLSFRAPDALVVRAGPSPP
jgi:cytochrome P450